MLNLYWTIFYISFPQLLTTANGPDPCLLAQNPRYRKGPDVCFDQDELVGLIVEQEFKLEEYFSKFSKCIICSSYCLISIKLISSKKMNFGNIYIHLKSITFILFPFTLWHAMEWLLTTMR